MTSNKPVYLDHAASSPLRPEALAAMLPFFGERFGNPSGSHALARAARVAIEDARDAMADALGCAPGEVVFTSGGTEADNLAITGTAAGRRVCSAVEHHAVLRPVEAAGGLLVPVDSDGVVALDALQAALGDDTAVVSVMLANNETGVVQQLEPIAEAVRALAPRAVLHTDAVAAFCWRDVARDAALADLVSVSAHKFGGPMGVGALVVREGVAVAPILRGGGQERERRSGTHNVAGVVGMAAAAQATVRARSEELRRIGALRDRLVAGLAGVVDGVAFTAPGATHTAGTLHVRVAGVESEALVFALDQLDVCASAGSACASGALEPNHVLAAMGADNAGSGAALRLSFGWSSTDADVDAALAALPKAIENLRAGSS
ncbi:MAG TPA: cysteine desulfurase family protein [Acidimicrobiales bacterium]|nr:cysteine desulfurase family protein [Acidimicrobiales bacterium]